MVARINTVAFLGIETLQIDVQVHMAGGLPAFTIVGLPDKAVAESRERVRAALGALGLALPPKRITVNLSPADVLKEGSHFDLPIALGILAASGQIPSKELDKYEFAGELSLSGRLRPVRGALAMTFAIQRTGRGARRGFILPKANADEAALVLDARVYPADTLLQVCAHFAADVLDAPLVGGG